MPVTYESTNDVIEAMYEGAQIAGIEPGGHDGQGNFHSDLPGFTVSYGRGFERSKWFSSMETAKSWVERKADDLLDN